MLRSRTASAICTRALARSASAAAASPSAAAVPTEKLPRRAGSSPLSIETTPGQTYAWCTCGLSARKHLCDGKHKTTGGAFKPLRILADKAETVWLCTCKATQRPDGRCDGSHLKPVVPPLAVAAAAAAAAT